MNNIPARQHILNTIKRHCDKAETIDTFHISEPGNSKIEDLPQQFVLKAKAVKATVQTVASIADIPVAIVEFVRQIKVDPNTVIAPEVKLKQLSWPDGLNYRFNCANKHDNLGVSLAFAAIARSGTLVFYSSPDSPVSINFLPENHIAILESNRIIADMEDLWPLIKLWPRALNLITGPSKTGDVEQTIVYGAHGPRRLHILIVE